MRPRDVASESKERCDLAYAVLKFDLIPIPDYSRRTEEHCRTTVADLGLDHIQQAGLLLRREPLRMCGLLLGRDQLRQAGIPAFSCGVTTWASSSRTASGRVR